MNELIIIAISMLIVLPVLFVAYRMFAEIYPALHFGPIYIPSSDDNVTAMFKLARIKNGEKVIDLGSGDGRLVIAAAQKGAYSVGVDLHKKMNAVARKNIQDLKLEQNAEIRSENMWKTDVSDFDVVLLYGIVYIMNKMEKKLHRELKKGARVVSNNAQFPTWKPVKEMNNVRLYIEE